MLNPTRENQSVFAELNRAGRWCAARGSAFHQARADKLITVAPVDLHVAQDRDTAAHHTAEVGPLRNALNK
jgi:hypothetical protein